MENTIEESYPDYSSLQLTKTDQGYVLNLQVEVKSKENYLLINQDVNVHFKNENHRGAV